LRKRRNEREREKNNGRDLNKANELHEKKTKRDKKFTLARCGTEQRKNNALAYFCGFHPIFGGTHNFGFLHQKRVLFSNNVYFFSQ
jgi:hypothetical protein